MSYLNSSLNLRIPQKKGGDYKNMADKSGTSYSMRLFGVPYQFNETTDPRIPEINTQIGKKYLESIMLEAPVITIIPGKPYYLPGKKKNSRLSAAHIMLQAADTGDSKLFKDFLSSHENKSKDAGVLRLYDFEKAYAEYIKYVNILCRTGAAFLGITDKISVGGDETEFTKFNWSKYHWTSSSSSSVAGNLVKWTVNKFKGAKFSFNDNSNVEEAKLEKVFDTANYVQFYVDPSSSDANDDVSNETAQSQLKQLFDQAGGWAKEFAFIANTSGFGNNFQNFVGGSLSSAGDWINDTLASGGLGTGAGAIARILNIGGNVLKGDNIIMPEIYQNTTRGSGHTVTIHLRSPYGDTLGFYMEVFVPLMHALGLVLPRQTSSNSYNSPFIIKAQMDGAWTSNLAIVESISIRRSQETRNLDGLPTELDVTLSIKDLYADLTMTPSNKPSWFLNNSSLVDYIATNCGMSITKPNFEKRIDAVLSALSNTVTDIPNNVSKTISESIDVTIENILRASFLT